MYSLFADGIGSAWFFLASFVVTVHFLHITLDKRYTSRLIFKLVIALILSRPTCGLCESAKFCLSV
jgi:hypothetical protein